MKKMTRTMMQFLLIITLLLQVILPKSFASPHVFNLEAKGQCGYITLSWNPIPNASFYAIYRGDSKENIHPMPLTDFPIQETSYIDETDIIIGQEYSYYVAAIGNDQKEFARSLIVSATPSCDRVTPVPPLPPCKLVLKYQIGNTIYWVNDDSRGPMDTAPIILHSRMFLVIRYVTQAIEGTYISWDVSERKVTILTRTGDTIELWIGKSQARINGQMMPIDPNNSQVVPIIKDGRTLLPLRFVGENMGASGVEDIRWNGSTQTVEIFVDDPECEKEGFRYPQANPLKGSFFEFSVEYHTYSNKFPIEINLVLTKTDNTKTLRLGPSSPQGKDLKMERIKTPKPTIEEINTSFTLARRYLFRMELNPGVLHFYRFTADEKEKLPSEGYLGPIYASLPGALRLNQLDFQKIDDGTSLLLEGYYTSEPYPMLVEDYWKIYERSSIPAGILLQLNPSQKIQQGSFVSIQGQKRTQQNKTSLLITHKVIFEQIIKQDYSLQENLILPPLIQTLQKPHRFAIIYTGCNDIAKVTDYYDIERQYSRSRADFTGDVLNNYRISINMGIPKENIYVNFGRGDEEIDYICADDGDGNPFDFAWDDAAYRNTMEQDAEAWWRADDGWRIRPGTNHSFLSSILDVYAKINQLPLDVTPEVYIFIATHGSPSGLCAYTGDGVRYDRLMTRLTRVMNQTMPSLTARSKIRILNNTCKAGAILPSAQEKFRLSGLDYVQIAASSSSSKLSYGQTPNHSEASYALAGGTFGIPFRLSLFEQLSSNSNFEVDWKVAHDYASQHDKYALGVERENADGSTYMFYSYPQYWYSRDLTLYQNGPAFEDPLSPEEEILVSHCRIGVDTSEAIFDVCNCSRSRSIHEDPKLTFSIVNKGIIPFKVVDIIADESVLSKPGSSNVFKFHDKDYPACRDYYAMDVYLTYNESHQFYVCLQNNVLNAQPLDENGYMATENNMPVFIKVPITVIYESGSNRFSQSAFIQIRVKAECYQLSYNTSIKRTETIKGKFSKWENLETACKITPAIPGLPNNVIAGPGNNNDFHMKISTDIFEQSTHQKISYGYMNVFKLQLNFDFMGESVDCIKEVSDLEGGGRVIAATLPPKLKGKMEVLYPPSLPTQNIIILIKPEAHSRDGYQSIIGKHTFQFRIRRMARFTCEYGASKFIEFNLTIDLEFTDPES